MTREEIEKMEAGREMDKLVAGIMDDKPVILWAIYNKNKTAFYNENIKVSKKFVNAGRRIDLLAAVLDALVRLQSLQEAARAGDNIGV